MHSEKKTQVQASTFIVYLPYLSNRPNLDLSQFNYVKPSLILYIYLLTEIKSFRSDSTEKKRTGRNRQRFAKGGDKTLS